MPRQSMNDHVSYVSHFGPRIGFGVTSKVWKCCRGRTQQFFKLPGILHKTDVQIYIHLQMYAKIGF